MAVFNAGSIEATLDLDRDPFVRGLELAKAEGRRFASEKYTARLDVDHARASGMIGIVRQELARVAGTYTAKIRVTGVATAAAEAAALDKQLEKLGGRRSVGVDASGITSTTTAARRGIMQLLPAIAILGTSLIPVTAALVPVLGLLNGLTLLAGGAGVALLATKGLGEAWKTTSAAALEPSTKNLEAMHAAMSALTPQARDFLGQLRSMSDIGSELQKSSAAGFFPGATRGLVELETALPRLNPLVYTLGDAFGIVTERSAGALNTADWQKFVGFLEAEARPGIAGMSEAIGNLLAGLAGMWQGFDPLNDDFTAWLVDVTQRFEDWGEGLESNDTFARFVAYVRKQGPQVSSTLSSIGGAFVDIIVAAAPLGGTVLQVLDHVGAAISAIADSPLGPTILTGAAALYTLNRALAVTGALMTKAGLGATAGAGAAAAGSKAGGFLGDIGAVMAPGSKTSLSGIAKAAAASDRLKASLGGVAKAGAGLGAVALLASGASEKLGLANTTTMALVGSMAGPWGAAAGAGVGLMMDFANASDLAEQKQRALKDALRDAGNDFVAQEAAFQGGIDGLKSYHQEQSLLGKTWEALDLYMTGDNAFTTLAADQSEARRGMMETRSVVEQLGRAMGSDFKDAGGRSMMPTLEQLTGIAGRAEPALQALGYELDGLKGMSDEGFARVAQRIAEWAIQSETSKGRTDAFAQSVADLGDEALSTADSADAMAAALDALLSPTLDAEGATNDWIRSVKGLRQELNSDAGFKGWSKAAIDNRDATLDYTKTAMSRLKALAGVSTTTEGQMAAAVRGTRKQLIESGMAAGFSRKEMVRRAKAMGLTPKLVRTVFEAAGASKSEVAARNVKAAYKQLPSKVQTLLRTEGVPTTTGQINQLVEKYKLTEKERKALITLKDEATRPGNKVNDLLTQLGKKHAQPTVSLGGFAGVMAAIGNIGNNLTNLNGRSAVVTTYQRTVRQTTTTTSPGVQRYATGGEVVGPGTATSDSILARLSAGEHVWTAREVANAGGHAAVEAMRNAYRYADGGEVKGARYGAAISTVGRAPAGMTGADVDRIVAAIAANRGLYVNVSSRKDVEEALEALEGELRRMS